MHKRFLSSLITGSLLISPVVAFAADITEEDVLNAIQPAPADGMGGGGGDARMIYPYYNGGVTVDASVTKEVTPDFVGLNAYCDLGKQESREAAKAEANKLYSAIKNAVGSDGRIRKMGGVSIYPFYDSTGSATDDYSANLSLFIRIIKPTAAQRISDAVENEGCTVNWDVRLLDPQSFEMDVLDTLALRLNKRKSVFEKLLGKRLTRITSASLNTWADGYSTYDPETNTVDATTTLTITFDLGGRTVLPMPRAMTPKG